MAVAWHTDRGLIRRNNEDSLLVDEGRGIFVVADGLGGHNAGEVASALTVDVIRRVLAAEMGDPARPLADPEGTLRRAVEAADAAVREGGKDPACAGMGTTVVVALVQGPRLYLCHVGDSRAYLYRDGLRLLTRDHTVGQELVDCYHIPRDRVPEEEWHVLTRAVGTGKPPVADLSVVPLVEGDILLLCTDGLTDMVSEEEMGAIIAGLAEAWASPGDAGMGRDDLVAFTARRLVQAALARGGRDNVSVVLFLY
ncbi:MAG TPA: protein phosphatase 2C domain-containing protein [Syntrophales bacterium]|nr:protein phosphatase 2C domain-containing protein [Syntrophales bacterium]HOM06515.1 protein phosphatase 2C domain-containing protein [Syntrophales bacterium]HON99900.1 protein phosphatase 2C domain-containing protein [Syntrophales bacterium]HPC00627.1 protein phosphatase 2C domain-containing protein [Syntrophales bacterium]HPQ06223.1 protein phosphatase 2C domain-containing protein [Syntrophales bacterium]